MWKPGPRRAGDVERSVLVPTLDAMGSVTDLASGLARTLDWFRARRG